MISKFIFGNQILCLSFLLLSVNVGAQAVLNTALTQRDIVVSNCDGINSKHFEFSPTFYGNGIAYLSTGLETEEKDKNIGDSFMEIFYSQNQEIGKLDNPKRFSVELSSQYHEGPLCFNADEDVIYFTRNNVQNGKRKKDEAGVTRLKIFEARKGQYDWERLQELPFNDDAYSSCHPTFVNETSTILFASDRPGGYGGMDLWQSSYESASWSVPVNLGSAVNSKRNEVFPYAFSDKLVFFSSTGPDAMGGLDIYAVVRSAAGWSSPIHLPAPINSAADDLGFIIADDLKSGYFTSSRLGGKGKDDIYSFSLNRPLFNMGGLKIPVNIQVISSANKGPVADVDLYIVEHKNDGLYAIDGPLLDLNFTALSEAEDIDISSLGKQVKALQTNVDGVLSKKLSNGAKYLIIAASSAHSATLKSFALTNQDNNKTIVFEMSVEESCGEITGRVADKINNTPLTAANLYVISSCAVEPFKLDVDKNGYYRHCFPCNCEYSISCGMLGFDLLEKNVENVACGKTKVLNFYLDQSKKAAAPAPPPPLKVVPAPIFADLSVGKAYVLNEIRFDHTSDAIRADAARELDELSQTLGANPSLKIELAAFTDSRGNANYNKLLSERRASSAKYYLVAKGIAATRIRDVGRGESNIRNHCLNLVECTDEEHAYNRRIEIIIVEN